MTDKQGYGPNLDKYLDKKLNIKLNANRRVIGTLRGYDQFMNLVIDKAEEVTKTGNISIGTLMIRGNSVIMWESLDKV